MILAYMAEVAKGGGLVLSVLAASIAGAGLVVLVISLFNRS